MDLNLNNKKVEQLISLLQDEDQNVYELIHNQILEMGYEVMPYLISAKENSFSQELDFRIEKICKELQFANTLSEIENWKLNNPKNLYQGLITLSKYQYRNLNTDEVSQNLAKIRQKIWLEIKDDQTALEKITIFNYIFFQDLKFEINKENYFAPENYFINDILQTKKGTQLSISAVYSILAQSLNIPVYGISLPRTYILAYVDDNYSKTPDKQNVNNVLFYINTLNSGSLHTQVDIKTFLREIKVKPEDSYFLPCSNGTTMLLFINALHDIYITKKDEENAAIFKKMMNLF